MINWKPHTDIMTLETPRRVSRSVTQKIDAGIENKPGYFEHVLWVRIYALLFLLGYGFKWIIL